MGYTVGASGMSCADHVIWEFPFLWRKSLWKCLNWILLLNPRKDTLDHRVHRVAMADIWRTFHDGKISPGWVRWGCRPTGYTERQRPFSGVYSITMEKLAQSVEGGGCTTTPFPYIHHHVQSCSERSSREGRYTVHFLSKLWTICIHLCTVISKLFPLDGAHLIVNLYAHWFSIVLTICGFNDIGAREFIKYNMV